MPDTAGVLDLFAEDVSASSWEDLSDRLHEHNSVRVSIGGPDLALPICSGGSCGVCCTGCIVN